MGLYDRDYSRGEESWAPSHSWSRGQNATSITVILVIVNVVLFFVDMILSGRAPDHSVLASWFQVEPDTILQPWTWYQFLTYGFLHDLVDIRHLAFNMLGLYIFGSVIERSIGRVEFLRFYLAAVIVGGVVTSLRWTIQALVMGVPVDRIAAGTIGASGGVMAVTILFALREPHSIIYVMMIFPVKAWLVAVLFVGMNIFGMIGATDNVAYDVHLAGAAFAGIYFQQRWKLERFGVGRWGQSLRELTRRHPRLRLHDPERRLAQEEADADRLLAKIQATGLDSLTAAERRTLERHSRRKRASRGK
ncbi:MAG: rhomboid family intramembrane serine protease [Planctomycetaceae bacterium]